MTKREPACVVVTTSGKPATSFALVVIKNEVYLPTKIKKKPGPRT